MLKLILPTFIILGFLGCGNSLTPKQIEARKTIEKKLYKRDNSKDIVYDSKKNLIWQDNIEAKDKKVNYSSAKLYCQSLDLAGYGDWRLPHIDELVSITTPYKKEIMIVPAFKNTASSTYWSDKVISKEAEYILLVNYDTGKSFEEQLSTFTPYHVRCVSDSKNLFTLNIDVFPKDSHIQIDGVFEEYKKGMKLRKGTYKLKVFKNGYVTRKGNVNLNKNTSLKIKLKKAN